MSEGDLMAQAERDVQFVCTAGHPVRGSADAADIPCFVRRPLDPGTPPCGRRLLRVAEERTPEEELRVHFDYYLGIAERRLSEDTALNDLLVANGYANPAEVIADVRRFLARGINEH